MRENTILIYSDSCEWDLEGRRLTKYHICPPIQGIQNLSYIFSRGVICCKKNFVTNYIEKNQQFFTKHFLERLGKVSKKDFSIGQIEKILFVGKPGIENIVEEKKKSKRVFYVVIGSDKRKAENLKRKLLKQRPDGKNIIVQENAIASALKQIKEKKEIEAVILLSDVCEQFDALQIENLANKLENDIVAVSPMSISQKETVLYAGATVCGLDFQASFFEGELKGETKHRLLFQERQVSILSSQAIILDRAFLEEVDFDAIENYNLKSMSIELSLQIMAKNRCSLYSGQCCIVCKEIPTEVVEGANKRWLRTYSTFLVKDKYSSTTLDAFLKKDKEMFYFSTGDFAKETDGHSILAFVHEMTLTGAPIVLMQALRMLKKQGYEITVISLKDGPLKEAFEKIGITVIIYPVLKNEKSWKTFALDFDLVIVNTAVLYNVVNTLGGTKVPVIWWIHEAEEEYRYLNYELPQVVSPNVRVYCVGHYAQSLLRKYRPKIESEILLYGVEDMKAMPQREEYLLPCDNKITFAHIGALQVRKGQNILTEAIELLPEEIRRQCRFVFVGKPYADEMVGAVNKAVQKYPENVVYTGEVNRENIRAIYSQVDCTICSSTDDPMPTFVTEGMMFSIPTICSEFTGTAAWVEKYNMGYCYENNDPRKLAERICTFVRKINYNNSMKENSRRLYDEQFSIPVFEKNINYILQMLVEKNVFNRKGLIYNDKKLRKQMLEVEKNICNGSKKENIMISVVIPTFNAGREFEKLLDLLKKQRGIEKIELIIVDSGSSDQTVELAQNYQANVIQISQEQFSHSYARNLGASKAKGEYILFMTQDALPESEYWLWKMYQPIKNGSNVVAVSCAEMPRVNADLYGAACSWFHMSFMGNLNQDRIMSMPSVKNYENIRKNSNLNDVACLIKASIHKKFKYRHSFAEDLDLGKRLINAGYKTALLGKTKVIHSHNRPAFYHLKRAFVERKAFANIFPSEVTKGPEEQDYIQASLYLYSQVRGQIRKLEKLKASSNPVEFVEQVREIIEKVKNTEIQTFGMETFLDENYKGFIKLLEEKIELGWKISPNIQEQLMNAYKAQINVSLEYLKSHAFSIQKLEKELVIKAMCSSMGCVMGLYLGDTCLGKKENSILEDIYDIAGKGV